MARDATPYASGSAFKGGGRAVDEPREGLFKVRLRGHGPWVPVRVWLEDGERCPETWELLSDQYYRAEWWPRTDQTVPYPAPYQSLINRLRPIDKDEFEWLLTLRTIPCLAKSPKR